MIKKKEEKDEGPSGWCPSTPALAMLGPHTWPLKTKLRRTDNFSALLITKD
jgi:hypothetical protein